MQLILQNCFRDELIARQKYFYETFHLWLIVNSKGNNYIKLTSMPTNCLDILFIIGHNIFVKEYLKCHEITEERIVAITCDGTIQTVDKVPGRSPGFSFIKFSTFLTFFHRFTKKNGSVINFIFQGFSSTS